MSDRFRDQDKFIYISEMDKDAYGHSLPAGKFHYHIFLEMRDTERWLHPEEWLGAHSTLSEAQIHAIELGNRLKLWIGDTEWHKHSVLAGRA